MLIQQIMGPLPAFDSLSFESQYLLNVSPAAMRCLARGLVSATVLAAVLLAHMSGIIIGACQDLSSEVRHGFHVIT